MEYKWYRASWSKETWLDALLSWQKTKFLTAVTAANMAVKSFKGLPSRSRNTLPNLLWGTHTAYVKYKPKSEKEPFNLPKTKCSLSVQLFSSVQTLQVSELFGNNFSVTVEEQILCHTLKSWMCFSVIIFPFVLFSCFKNHLRTQ